MSSNIIDEIGPWTEVKLEIIKEYATAYSTILNARPENFHHVYIDAFAGLGLHRSKTSGEFVPGSPMNALMVSPPFKEYNFIDIEMAKVENLESISQERPQEVKVYHGDCNEILLNEVFTRIEWRKFRRALCLLDPYKLQLDWNVIKMAGKMKTIEIFLNFPIMHINRAVLRRDQENVSTEQKQLMTRYWGDDSWLRFIRKTPSLFKDVEFEEKASNIEIVNTFRDRLKKIAGFSDVPEPTPMKNTKGGTVYYLFFASHKSVAKYIVEDIFKKYREG
ncbi:MAG: three-Cys-motif partner protein TcmP [Planctomycetota bacterium]|jgi:three-Cys-motif partner protein